MTGQSNSELSPGLVSIGVGNNGGGVVDTEVVVVSGGDLMVYGS